MATSCPSLIRARRTQGIVTRVLPVLLAVATTACGETLPLASPPETCEPAVTSVQITPFHAELLPGQSFNYTATVVATGCVTDFRTTWRSSDTTIATVSPAGNVAALASGDATITAVSTFDTLKRATSTVRVR